MWHKHWGNAVFTVEIPESKSQQGEETRYIQMVQTHGLVQLSLEAASINGVINADSKFLLWLTPDVDSKPRDPIQTLVRDVFSMMKGERQEGVDLPYQRLKWNLHRIFFQYYGIN
jgi:hypothetical protein